MQKYDSKGRGKPSASAADHEKKGFRTNRKPPLPKKQASQAAPAAEPSANEQQPLRDDLVIGRNSVVELLKAGRPVEAVYITPGGQGSLSRIVAMAKERDIPVKDASPTKLDHLCAGANHQGVAAITSGAEYAEMEDIFARAGSEPVFLVIADEIEDPHNLGAIIRTAEAAGAHGLIIPKRRSAGLSFAVHKASAGAAEHLPVVRVANLATTIEELKKKGVWIYAADMDGSTWCETDFSGPVGLVIGSEGSGVGRLIKEKSDFVVSLPLCGQINSLNASVAAGILLYEVARQRLHLKAR